jgi:hypothetical protein
MIGDRRQVFGLAFAAFLSMSQVGSPRAWAHCDTMDGPVVKAAERALETGDVNLVLIWVQRSDEPEVTRAFQQTLAVRTLSPEAKQLADTWFFETLVRLHRAGEGAPYTGLQPAGRDLGPVIPAADEAIVSGSLDALQDLLVNAVRTGLRERFEQVMATKNFNRDDIAGGREFVRAYVSFVHYVEGLHEAAAKASHGHAAEAEAEREPARRSSRQQGEHAEHEH